MKFHILERSADARDLLLPSESIVQRTQTMGLNCNRARAVFVEEFGLAGPLFKLISKNGRDFDLNRESLPDMFLWSWLPIFSERAVHVLSTSNVNLNDFLCCGINDRSWGSYYIHLPQRSVGGMCVEQSEFKTHIPLEPPIPFGTVSLKFRTNAFIAEHIFRVEISGAQQVLSELFVSDVIRAEWARRRLVGAKFRSIQVSAHQSDGTQMD